MNDKSQAFFENFFKKFSACVLWIILPSLITIYCVRLYFNKAEQAVLPAPRISFCIECHELFNDLLSALIVIVGVLCVVVYARIVVNLIKNFWKKG